MKKRSATYLVLAGLLWGLAPAESFAQDDLLEELDSAGSAAGGSAPVIATFKASRIINGQSVEGAGKGELQFVVSHRFGQLDQGLKTFFGLDEANTMLSLEYGITDRFQIALQRSSHRKIVDGFVKYRFLNQSVDDRRPLSAALFLEASVNTETGSEDAPAQYGFRHRWAYTGQLLLARKFGETFSLQLSPTLLHRNLVPLAGDPNNMPVIGAGARYKLSNRVTFNVEYFYRLREDEGASRNPFSVGFDIETGGHVFQLHLTNAREMTESGFLAGTTGDFFRGNIHFGFNISRVFQLGGKPRADGHAGQSGRQAR